jgi:hypothetical protein
MRRKKLDEREFLLRQAEIKRAFGTDREKGEMNDRI